MQQSKPNKATGAACGLALEHTGGGWRAPHDPNASSASLAACVRATPPLWVDGALTISCLARFQACARMRARWLLWLCCSSSTVTGEHSVLCSPVTVRPQAGKNPFLFLPTLQMACKCSAPELDCTLGFIISPLFVPDSIKVSCKEIIPLLQEIVAPLLSVDFSPPHL